MNRRDFNLFLPGLAALAVQPKPEVPPEPLIVRGSVGEDAVIGHWLQAIYEFKYNATGIGMVLAKFGIARINPADPVPHIDHSGLYYHGKIICLRYQADYSSCDEPLCDCHKPSDVVSAVGITDETVTTPKRNWHRPPRQCDNCKTSWAYVFCHGNPTRRLCHQCDQQERCR